MKITKGYNKKSHTKIYWEYNWIILNLFGLFINIELKKSISKSLGFNFYDVEDYHTWPDYLVIGLWKCRKTFHMPWTRVFYRNYYPIQEDIVKSDMNILKRECLIDLGDGNIITAKYWEEKAEWRFKIFKWFINYKPKFYNRVDLEFRNENGLQSYSMFLENPSEDSRENLKRVCDKENIRLI